MVSEVGCRREIPLGEEFYYRWEDWTALRGWIVKSSSYKPRYCCAGHTDLCRREKTTHILCKECAVRLGIVW